jgi:D-cysteine desulfhydrase
VEGAEAALQRLEAVPSLALVAAPTPLEEMPRLRVALGGGPRLLVKRDDAIPFGFGGNKVRKLAMVAAEALAAGADTLVTTGSVQSNHARATAAVAAKLGLGCSLILNGTEPNESRANTLLDELLGAEIEYVETREKRDAAVNAAVERLQRAGQIPYPVPLGASTSLGALGFVQAVGELLEQAPAPDVIVHASSSGGTQAGLVAGCALYGLETRVIGISADEPAAKIDLIVREMIAGIGELLGCDGETLADACQIEVDDGFIGAGYAQPTLASREAQSLAAHCEALFVDHSYTAKALAALIRYVRASRFTADESVLFWHTGGQLGLFA